MSKSILGAVGTLVLLGLASAWWVMTAVPTPAQIEAARTSLPTVEAPDLTLLKSSSFVNGRVPAGLPVPIDAESLGRSDPYAQGN